MPVIIQVNLAFGLNAAGSRFMMMLTKITLSMPNTISSTTKMKKLSRFSVEKRAVFIM
jgi:hypothetical protein